MKTKIQLSFLLAASMAIGMPCSAESFELLPATFEDLELAPESFWCGDTEDEDYMMGEFASGYFSFNNMYIADWDIWAFFAYANLTDTLYETPADQYKCAAGGGHNSPTYCLAYPATYMGYNYVWVYGNDEGDVLKGMWITNSAWVKDAVYHGDGISGPFTQGDMLTLVIRGIDYEDHILAEKRVPLADFTDSDPRNHYCLDTWQWVSLSELGAVYGLKFEIESTKANAYGVTTPTYFCLDDLHTDRDIIEAEPVVIASGGSVDVRGLFSFNSEVADVKYNVEGEGAQITDNGLLCVSAAEGETLPLILSACQRGCSEYVSLPVEVKSSTGIYTSEVNRFEVSASAEGVKIVTGCEDYSAEIFTATGNKIADYDKISGSCKIEMPLHGILIVKIKDNCGKTFVTKILR